MPDDWHSFRPEFGIVDYSLFVAATPFGGDSFDVEMAKAADCMHLELCCGVGHDS
jgi:hypothetical protein